MASSASKHRARKVDAPNGKSTTVQTLTAQDRSCREQNATSAGFTQTEAKPNLRASRQSF
jgi:hypothetical protein